MIKYAIFVFVFFSGFPSCTHRNENSVIKTTLDRVNEEKDSSKDPYKILWTNQDKKDFDLQKEDEDLNESLNLADHSQQAEVKKWIEYYAKTHKKSFVKMLEEASYYKPMIKSILRQEKIPTYFYYLPIIESGFQTHAKSHAKAVGIWQFVSSTAKNNGLRVDEYVDERQDPIRSTFAAAQHLKALYEVFHSWPLALAAYNTGEMRIVGSVMAEKNRDFWTLARKKKLPKETCQFIPKFMAAALIGNHPEKYGISFREKTFMPQVYGLSFSGYVSFSDISKATGIPVSDLDQTNPHLKSQHKTPKDTKNYKNYMVWVPKIYSVNPELALQIKSTPYREKNPSKSSNKKTVQLKESTKKETQSLIVKDAKNEHNIQYYGVQKGDNLIKIAHKFQIPVKELRIMNGIYEKKVSLQIGQKIKVSR